MSPEGHTSRTSTQVCLILKSIYFWLLFFLVFVQDFKFLSWKLSSIHPSKYINAKDHQVSMTQL